MGLLAPIRDYVETLVHPSAQQDALTASRHRAFIAPRLLGSIIALAAFPVYLIARGAPSTIELMVFAWLMVPILTAYFLSRTGRYESAHVLSSLALTGLVTAVAASTGGIVSFAAIWLVVVPLEAALSASRRVVATASTLALAAAGVLVLLDAMQLLPMPSPNAHGALAALGIVSAALYAAGLALGAEALARTSFWLLYAEEDRYRLLARNITDVITRHGRDGVVLFMSPAGETLFGSRIADLHGHGLFERVQVADRPAYLTALGDAAALGESRSVEFRVRRDGFDANGNPMPEFVWVEMRCRPLDQAATDGGHGRREVVAVLRDVTGRKQQERALEDARAEAERANAAKSRFLATMSHELRTPLNAIIGFSDMLKEESALMLDAKRRGEYAGLINDSGNHLLAVVNGILDMSKIETGNFEITPEPFAPAQVIAGCCDILALRAREAGVTLEKLAVDGLPEIVADKRALNQILLNLLSNAIRFTDRGGKVTIGARAEAATVSFTVEDNGVGISDEDLARVGEPYFQARASYDRRHGGTGLGLSIVKGLVELHGGEVSIRSRVGEGTRITVRLPIDCERARPAQRRAQESIGAVNIAAHQMASAGTVQPANPVNLRDVSSLRSDRAVKKRA
ncbi:MAG TPA: PAS domain-containing sensor histidine kinase [Xanthobacteraceae bacterium]|nr:PAS domain-containing sensor histidine kinase [Xanthobacteraceae bacterium]